ncbi:MULTISPECIES: choline ABC transporter ATP-binding protein [Paracoccus]|jgi:glycine betaine/proline transport system ATP-binding protein|uniref:ABC transporter related protein n=2 Tax=Paracoccus denitrificans TaxID=266 RepID=A1B3A2_PARDP|nr:MULTISPECIES: choline ABC transporter ATP-binding protein [Paracoccus]ABL69996.1 ABC transporter related protein [Paracoccus denitrificans PD1222]MBB4627078.1 glycine betaine/proline transport system ATP-binding protein [Paracoccus denitrificans]MCU7428463.1 choline ABC transporter ATP-binding protein [Paracoccus denitrificans]MDK8871646.1 choline ABC transporter ATP-binding protein [Paracoccus sp. SSJ]UFS65199.1 choline ABC transporter ATP-binding protein [Paracoccus denitrificans]
MSERMQAAHNAVEFDNVNIVFGDAPNAALPLMDQGLERGPIKAETGQVLGVHNCSLTVREGEILVLMGLSGSGKSTLLRAVNGLNAVCRGEVRIWDGDRMASVTKASGAELRRLRRECIAMVFQQFGLLPWRSVRENVGLGLELAGIPAAERRKRVDAQLATVGLAEWAERKVGDLSGGMQQRVGLARAFATEAPILLMDEPFSALDPLIRNRLQDELLELQQRFRRTIIFVSHDLDEAFRIGNRIALMEGGRIVQVGTAREIIANPVNAYVEDFVAHMNPLAVLTAEDMAEPGEAAGEPIDPETPVREVIQIMTEADAEMLPLQGGRRVTRQGIMTRLVAQRSQGGGAVEH